MDPKPAEGEEQKKRRGRKKSKLEDMFPAYLQVCSLSLALCLSGSSGTTTQLPISLKQEAFFGKTLIDMSKKAVMIPPVQRPGMCPSRPPEPALPGVKPATQEGMCPYILDMKSLIGYIDLLNQTVDAYVHDLILSFPPQLKLRIG